MEIIYSITQRLSRGPVKIFLTKCEKLLSKYELYDWAIGERRIKAEANHIFLLYKR